MYIRTEKKRRSSPIRILFLLILIIAGIYVLTERQDVLQLPGPTPTPTLSAAYYIEQGDVLSWEGKYPLAIASYQSAAEQDPTQAVAYARAARLLALRGYHREAVRHANLGVEADPVNVEAKASLCMALDWDGQYDEAIFTCLEAIEIGRESCREIV